MVNLQNLFQARAEFIYEMKLLEIKNDTACGLFSNLLMNGYCSIVNTENSKAKKIKDAFERYEEELTRIKNLPEYFDSSSVFIHERVDALEKLIHDLKEALG